MSSGYVLRAVCTKNYSAELYEIWVMEKWNDGNFTKGKEKDEFQKSLLGGVT